MLRLRRRLQVCRQLDARDCSAACLDMIARYYGRHVTREELRRASFQDNQGTSLGGLTRAADSIGLDATCIKTSYAEAKSRVQPPFIAFWYQGHYVVVERFTKKGAILVDPAAGRLSYTQQEFEALWLRHEGGVPRGIVVSFAPQETPGSGQIKRRTADRTRFLASSASMMMKVAPGILLSLAMLMGIQFVAPFVNSLMVDEGIQRGAIKILISFSVLQFSFVLMQATLQGLQAWMLVHAGKHINVALAEGFITKLCSVKASFFQGRQIGDLIQRFADQAQIQQAISVQLVEWLQGLVTVAVFAGVLFVIDRHLFSAYAVVTLIFAVVTTIFLDKQRVYNYKVFRASSQKQSAMLDLFETMSDIRLSNAEKDRQMIFATTYKLLADASVKSDSLTVLQRSATFIIFEGAAVFMLYLVAHRAVSVGATIGIVVATQYVLGQLAQPIMRLSSLAAQWQSAKLSFDRSNEIHRVPDESSGSVTPNALGDITLENVTFAYGGGVAVLKSVSCRLRRGETTAIVGTSGSGKSTLLRLLLKFDEPTEGCIHVGAWPLADVSTCWWRQECAVVTQDGGLLADSLGTNISLGRPLDSSRLRNAAEKAQILDFIDSLPLGFETRVGRDGVGLSKGQLQRILLARAFYKEANILMLDEATSALDTENEHRLVEAIKRGDTGRTRIVIAHRLSTIRDADHIIVLDKGSVAEEGTHEDLLKRNGRYASLVKHQLARSECDAPTT